MVNHVVGYLCLVKADCLDSDLRTPPILFTCKCIILNEIKFGFRKNIYFSPFSISEHRHLRVKHHRQIVNNVK